MAILGIGVDLVHIPRITALISRRTEAKFAAKILSPVEYAQWNALRHYALASSPVSVMSGGGGGGESRKEYESKESRNAHATQSEAEAARVRFLAVRWSVKEAAYKAMYPYARATWKELSYTGLTTMSKPRVEYLPSVPSPNREGNMIGKLHVSVSHDGEYVYASVLAESKTFEGSGVDQAAPQAPFIGTVSTIAAAAVVP